MANRFFGEVTANMGGQDYTLRLDLNTLCELDDLTGGDSEVLNRIQDGTASVKDLRSLILASMLHHRPDATARDAGLLLSEQTDVLAKLVAAAMPTQEEVKNLPGNRKAARKPKASTI